MEFIFNKEWFLKRLAISGDDNVFAGICEPESCLGCGQNNQPSTINIKTGSYLCVDCVAAINKGKK